MAENTQSAAHRTTNPRPQAPGSDSPAAAAVWVIPAPVLLTADQVAAALYAFSDLIGECADPTVSVVREELRFLLARHGADAIERIAEWIEANGPARLPGSLRASVKLTNRQALRARLGWCRQQSQTLLAAGAG